MKYHLTTAAENTNSNSQYVEHAAFCNEKGKVIRLNEMFFADLYCKANKLIYKSSEKTFYQYNPSTGLWDVLTTQSLKKNINELVVTCCNSAGYPQLIAKRTQSFLSQVINALQFNCENPEAFLGETTDFRYHCSNGVLRYLPNENQWRLDPFSPEDYSRDRAEVTYDPNATCPNFMKFLDSGLDSDCIELMQLYFGQVLIGRNLSQTMLLLSGKAGTGKSTVVTMLEKLIGLPKSAELRLEHLGGRFETSQLMGKSLLTAKDVSEDYLRSKHAFRLKEITGSDQMKAELKFQNKSIAFRGQFNLIITSNTLLRIKLESDRDAWKRRILLIEYTKERPEMIFNLEEILTRELSGILNWAMEGVKKLFAMNCHIKLSEALEKRVDNLLDESDQIANFLSDCVQVDEYSDSTIQELGETYQLYLQKRGYQEHVKRSFGPEVAAEIDRRYSISCCHDIKRGDSLQRGFRGLKLIYNFVA